MVSARIPSDRQNGLSLGHGFVNLEGVAAGCKAVEELNGYMVQDHLVRTWGNMRWPNLLSYLPTTSL